MDTNDLIRTLAADNTTHERSVGHLLLAALVLAVPVSTLMFLAGLGVRPDVMTAMRNPLFDLKFLVTLALAAIAIAVSLHLSRPEASLGRWAWLLAVPLGLLGIGMVGEMAMMPNRAPMPMRMIGSNSKLCLVAIPLLSLPLLAAALFALRRGASSRPAVTGAFAGLLSAGLAATLYAAHCTDDSPMFVATWYSLAAVIVAAIGAFAGSRVLKF